MSKLETLLSLGFSYVCKCHSNVQQVPWGWQVLPNKHRVRFVVLQKRGETSLHMCADLQVSSCPPEMNLFWRRLFSEKNVLNAQKTASNGLPFQRLMFGCCGVYPTPGWYQELRFSARYQTMNQRHRAAATVVFWVWFSLFWMVSLDSNLSLKLRDCYHGMNGTVFPI